MEWKKTDSPGITFKFHATRKNGVGKDKYFRGQFQANGKRRTIGFGWLTDGWTESICLEKIKAYKENAKAGQGPTSLKEELALAREQKARDEAERRALEAQNVSFATFFLENYLPQAQHDKNGDHGKRKSFFSNWINPTFGNKPIRSIGTTDIETLKARMQDAEKAPRTIQYVLAVVRQVFNRAIALGILEGINPVKTVKMPKN